MFLVIMEASFITRTISTTLSITCLKTSNGDYTSAHLKNPDIVRATVHIKNTHRVNRNVQPKECGNLKKTYTIFKTVSGGTDTIISITLLYGKSFRTGVATFIQQKQNDVVCITATCYTTSSREDSWPQLESQCIITTICMCCARRQT